MNYERIIKIKEELKTIKSDFVSIPKEDYNALLKIIEDDTVCINETDEVELDTSDLISLVNRCLK